MKWNNIQTKTELEYIFNEILKECSNLIVTKIFCLEGTFFHSDEKNIKYLVDAPIYIKLNNNYCLIITLLHENDTYIEYRKMTDIETEQYGKLMEFDKDLFNVKHEIHEWEKDINGNDLGVSEKIKETIEINVEYSKIKYIEIRGFSHEYDKWIQNEKSCEVITIPAGGDYFDQIEIVMDNDVKICICPRQADDDGYCDLWYEGNSINTEYKYTSNN